MLKRLNDARTRPVWAMVDVYAGSQEVLLRLIGISRPRSAVFTPAADYVLEARMPAKNRMELRFRGGDLKLIEQTSLTATDSQDVVTAAGKWVESQVAKHPAKPQAAASLHVAFEDDWAKEQARLEYKMAEELKQRRQTFKTEAEKRMPDGRHYNFLPKDKRELDRLEFRCREHFRRAAQLDPTWEGSGSTGIDKASRPSTGTLPSTPSPAARSIGASDRRLNSRRISIGWATTCNMPIRPKQNWNR